MLYCFRILFLWFACFEENPWLLSRQQKWQLNWLREWIRYHVLTTSNFIATGFADCCKCVRILAHIHTCLHIYIYAKFSKYPRWFANMCANICNYFQIRQNIYKWLTITFRYPDNSCAAPPDHPQRRCEMAALPTGSVQKSSPGASSSGLPRCLADSWQQSSAGASSSGLHRTEPKAPMPKLHGGLAPHIVKELLGQNRLNIDVSFDSPREYLHSDV